MQEFITEILIYMKVSLHQQQTIEEIADHFGYSKYHFSRKFKQVTGFSAADYLSSLKVEQAKQALLNKQADVTNASLDAGFSSLGTFSKNFSEKTGLSPREYIKQVDTLYGVAHTISETEVFRNIAEGATPDVEGSSIHITYILPEEVKVQILFSGLFKTPIPNHRPVIGVALRKTLQHTFKHIPDGKYYVLSTAVETHVNPLRYFDFSDSYRGRVEPTIVLPRDTDKHFELQLRKPLPEDPPILINLPKLIADTFKLKK